MRRETPDRQAIASASIRTVALLSFLATFILPLPARTDPPATAEHPTPTDPHVLQQIIYGDDELEEDIDAPSPPETDAGPSAKTRPVTASPTPSGPAGSISLGYPAAGTLLHARKIPEHGPGYALLPTTPRRGTGFGTDDIVGLLQRAAAKVVTEYPGAILRIGNISRASGGKIPWSVSHQAGRDCDVAFYVDDRRGRPVDLTAYEHFSPKGVGREHRRWRFSVPKNWAFIRAILTDPEVQVQRVFVQSGLRKLLLDHAQKTGAPKKLIEQASTVLMQPTHSSPHSDHFHIRIYCSREDLLEGCHDYEPHWPWVATWTSDVAARIAELTQSLRRSDATTKTHALTVLRRLAARSATQAVRPLLLDDDSHVRVAALRLLRSVAPGSLPASIAHALPHVTSVPWARQLIDALDHGTQPAQAALLERIVVDPTSVLDHIQATESQAASLRASAAAALARAGRRASVQVLIAQLTDPYSAVRKAAARSLTYLTNHDLRGRWRKGTSKKRLLRQQKRWARWLHRNKRHTQSQWIRLGFKKRGIRFRGKMLSQRAIPTLIKATQRGGYLAHNALRVLRQLVGPGPSTRCRTDMRCWRRWWTKNHRKYGHRRAKL